ncbi:hypothetical protein MATL_G00244370 [Megalops atlanticus]|uniref:Leptin n=1 Tax=Megalops atlanticus TaxID=7932 RepID=A0A9D3SUU5_MEGAT|nr:hypothetical protein MATL_G00244370 [Megalops atlanticus]
MKPFLSLHYSSLLFLLAVGSSTAPPVDIVKNNMKLLAETAVMRIQKLTAEFQISPNMVFSGVELIPDITLDRPVEGISSIADNISTFQVILLSLPLDSLRQINADMEGLQGIVRSLAASFHCPLHKPVAHSHLDTFLKANVTFHVTIANIALNRLQRFLSRLINSLDQLKTC